MPDYETLECQFCYGRVADGTEGRVLRRVRGGGTKRCDETNESTRRVRGVRGVVDIRLLRKRFVFTMALARRKKKKNKKEKVRFCHKKRLLDAHGARHNARLLTQSISVVVVRRRRRVYSVCRVRRGRSNLRKVGSERGDAGVDVAFYSKAKRFYVEKMYPLVVYLHRFCLGDDAQQQYSFTASRDSPVEEDREDKP